MGCSNQPQANTAPLLEQYNKAGLTPPWSDDYKNNFEKEIYMAINLCRHDPKGFVPHVRRLYKEHELLKGGLGKNMNELIQRLNTQEQLRPLKFDATCNEAVRAVNAERANDDAPVKGGNIAKYSEISGADKAGSCKEFTMIKYDGQCGIEFVALELALDFEGLNEGAKAGDPKVKAAVGTETAPAKESELLSGTPAEAQPNAMGGEEAQPNGMGGEESKEPAKDKAPATTTEAKPADKTAAKDKAPEKEPGYSPILDSELESLGICFLAHKKTVNITQILYAKPATNTMA